MVTSSSLEWKCWSNCDYEVNCKYANVDIKEVKNTKGGWSEGARMGVRSIIMLFLKTIYIKYTIFIFSYKLKREKAKYNVIISCGLQ